MLIMELETLSDTVTWHQSRKPSNTSTDLTKIQASVCRAQCNCIYQEDTAENIVISSNYQKPYESNLTESSAEINFRSWLRTSIRSGHRFID